MSNHCVSVLGGPVGTGSAMFAVGRLVGNNVSPVGQLLASVLHGVGVGSAVSGAGSPMSKLVASMAHGTCVVASGPHYSYLPVLAALPAGRGSSFIVHPRSPSKPIGGWWPRRWRTGC